eukprot:TRINITY_DN612_c0_g2_i4.p1 TRINITY_DN612_c0_g2~~TRINITY_DN612_c0_g2_i4.p1  ORF type:complete len:330 (+),score=47.79 TRINITY_DN612_c0_g2_i4:505-1494(+)
MVFVSRIVSLEMVWYLFDETMFPLILNLSKTLIDSIEDCELNINLIDFGSSWFQYKGTWDIGMERAAQNMGEEVVHTLAREFGFESEEYKDYSEKFMNVFYEAFPSLEDRVPLTYPDSTLAKSTREAWVIGGSLALISKEHNPAFEDKSEDEKAALIEKVRKQYANDSKVKTSIHDIHEKYQKLLGKLVPAIKDKSDDAKAALIEKVRKQYTNESEGITTIQDIREKYQKLLAKLDDKKRTRRDNIFQVEIGNMTLADFYKTINDHGMTVLRLGSTEDNSMLAILWGNTNKQYTKGLKVCPYSNTCIRPKFMESPFSYVNVFNERNSNG